MATYTVVRGNPNGNEITVVTSGILARTAEQVAPVQSVWTERGDVYLVDVAGNDFDPDTFSWYVAGLIDSLPSDKAIRFVGISYTATLVPLIIQKVTRTDRIVVDLIDPPFGARTLAQVPVKTSGLMGGVLFLARPGPINDLWGNRLLNKMAVPPKRESIELSFYDGINPEAYKDHVIATSTKNLKGHKLSMFASQMRFITRDPAGYPWHSLSRYDVTVYVCFGRAKSTPNDTVRQPMAAVLLKRVLPNATYVEVHTMHAAFAEAKITWNTVLRANY